MLEGSYIICPYCGESIEISIDVSAGTQDYIEDCQICCRPIEIRVQTDSQTEFSVEVKRDDE